MTARQSPQNDVSEQPEIHTFVFFDLETTGLIQGSNLPKITEISLIATSRHSLFTKDGALPRVMHKLVIPLQPMRPIPLIVSQITGLYNDLLENEPPFDDLVFELLNAFIVRLRPPICFIAHNGSRFDYPILLSELKRIGKTVSDDVLCVDSLHAFKAIIHGNRHDNCNKSISRKITKEDNLSFFDDGCDEELAVLADVNTSPSTSIEFDQIDETRDKCDMDTQSLQNFNETTPTHENSPSNINRQKRFDKISGLPAKKRLPFTRKQRVSLALPTVYEYLVGEAPLNSHMAEGDCLSLLHCVVKIPDQFISWADSHAVPLMQYEGK